MNQRQECQFVINSIHLLETSNHQNDEIVLDNLTHPSLFDQRLTTIQSMIALIKID